jgi:hypothetical protein
MALVRLRISARASSLLLVVAFIWSWVHPCGPGTDPWGRVWRNFPRISFVMAVGGVSDVGVYGVFSETWSVWKTASEKSTGGCSSRQGAAAETLPKDMRIFMRFALR